MKTAIILYSIFALINLAFMLTIYFKVVKDDEKESKKEWLMVTLATVFGSAIASGIIIYCALSSLTIKNFGFIFRPKSFWIGIHYSDYNKRFCMNIVPGFTIWWIKKGGTTPHQTKKDMFTKTQVSNILDIVWLNFASHVPKSTYNNLTNKHLNK